MTAAHCAALPYPYHNVVFVGQDTDGKARYANLRGIGTDFKGEANGSDKRFSFSIPAMNSDTVHLFESAVDLLLIVCIVPVVWLALLIAPLLSEGLIGIITGFPKAIENPLHIKLCEDSVKTVLVLLLSYGMGIGIYFSTKRTYRRGEEHGSAKWGDVHRICNKYRAKDEFENRIFTKNFRMGLDGRKHRRNLNTLVCGGSGSGKSRFYAKVNLLQANTSFFVLDCKGELLRDTGNLLAEKGYEIKVLDLLNMEKSHCYNPFAYLETDNDVQKLVTNLFKATTPKGSQSQDPFWDTSASMLLLALIFYLKYEAPPDEQNFTMVLEMLRAADVREEDETYQSPLDELFERLEMRNPDHIAVKYYKDYCSHSVINISRGAVAERRKKLFEIVLCRMP